MHKLRPSLLAQNISIPELGIILLTEMVNQHRYLNTVK